MIKLARVLFKINIVLAIIAILLLAANYAAAEPLIYQRTPGQFNVMVIDTGINPHDKLTKFVQYENSRDYKDTHGHGTHIAGIVVYGDLRSNEKFVPSCDIVKIKSCKYYEKQNDNFTNTNGAIKCLLRAVKERVDVIVYAGGGITYVEDEAKAVELAEKANITIIVAAGNEEANMDDHFRQYYPAYLSKRFGNVIPVGNLDRKSNRAPTSNYGLLGIMQWDLGTDVRSTYLNNQYAEMSGTSQATPMFLYHYLKRNCTKLKQEKKK